MILKRFLALLVGSMDYCAHQPCPSGYACYNLANSSFSCIFDAVTVALPSCQHWGHCLNGGSCVPAYPNNFCLCLSEWTGDDCSVRSNDTELVELHHVQQLHNVAVAIGALVTAFLLAFLLVMFCHCKSSRRWAICQERCKRLMGKAHSPDIDPIVDITSLQQARLCPQVIYFTANEVSHAPPVSPGSSIKGFPGRPLQYCVDDGTDEAPISALTGRALNGPIYAQTHHLQHFRI